MRSRHTHAAMVTASVVLFVGVALVSAVFFSEGDDFHCSDRWFLVSELLLVGSVIASAWSSYLAFRARWFPWLLTVIAVIAGAIVSLAVWSTLVTPVDTEPDASPRSEQCDSV